MTSFDEIYDVFLSQISDPVFAEKDMDDELKYRYLLNSIPKFRRCKQDLSDRTNTQFNSILTDEEIVILGSLMLLEYLNPMIISLENIKQFMNSKDFYISSQANQLKQLTDVKEMKRREVDRLIIDYTYNNGKLDDLR